MIEAIKNLWSWMTQNDLPNWVIFIFTVFFWPLALFAWSQKKVVNIPNLEVAVLNHKGGLIIDGEKASSAEIRFINNTGSVVYLTNYRLTKCTKKLLVHFSAEYDINGPLPLNFFNESTGRFELRQITLQTGQTASTAIPLQSPPSQELLTYKPSMLRKLFKWQKYFWLEYTALVGKKRYNVRAIF